MYQCNCKRCTWQSVPDTTALRSDYNSPTILESRAPKAIKWFIFSAFSHLFAFPLGFFLHQNWLIYILVSKILSMQFNSWQTIYARSWVNSYGRFKSAYYISQVCYNNIIDDPLQCTHTHRHTQLSISNWSGVNVSSRQFRTFHFTIGQCNLECELQLKCQSIAKRQWEICTIHKCGSNWVESVTERPTLALCLPHSLSLSLSLTDLFTHYAWHATCRQCEDMAS